MLKMPTTPNLVKFLRDLLANFLGKFLPLSYKLETVSVKNHLWISYGLFSGFLIELETEISKLITFT